MLDTDIIRSGLQSASGASRLLLCAVAEGALRPLVSVAILFEHEAVLLRPETLLSNGLSRAETYRFLDGYLAAAERVSISRRLRPSIKDPSDELFVEALVNGGGVAIVSFNRRDYLHSDIRLASQGKTMIPVISPGEALRRLPWRPTAMTTFAFP